MPLERTVRQPRYLHIFDLVSLFHLRYDWLKYTNLREVLILTNHIALRPSSQPRYGQAYDAEKMARHSWSVHEGKVKHGFITFPSDNDYFLLFVSLLETIKINVNNSRWIYVV